MSEDKPKVVIHRSIKDLAEICGPLVLGCYREPVIHILSQETLFSKVLSHEYIHHQRRDFWIPRLLKTLQLYDRSRRSHYLVFFLFFLLPLPLLTMTYSPTVMLVYFMGLLVTFVPAAAILYDEAATRKLEKLVYESLRRS